MVGSLIAAMIFIVFGFVYENDPTDVIGIGEKAPSAKLKMQDVSGENYSLNDLVEQNGLLVIFSCNDCPFVVGRGDKEGWEDRYPKYSKMTSGNGIGMVLVNSNEAKRPGIDSMDEMKMRAKDKGYTTKYVLDQNSKLADAFGAKTTPHVFLFNADMVLVYKGAIDDNVDSAKGVEEYYLEDALNALVNGKRIDPNSTKNIGCSIKRVKA